MINKHVLIIILFFSHYCVGQDDTLAYDSPDVDAKFTYRNCENTVECIKQFVTENAVWPSQDDVLLSVYVKCIVEKNGELTQLQVVKGDNGLFDAASLELIKKMPPWTPARNMGEIVRSVIYIPVKWDLF